MYSSNKRSRHIDKLLKEDRNIFHTRGITVKQNYSRAIPERAAADLLYYNPHYHLDNPNLLNWDRVRQIQKEVQLTP